MLSKDGLCGPDCGTASSTPSLCEAEWRRGPLGMVLITYLPKISYADHSNLNCNNCSGSGALADQPLHTDAVFN